MARLAEVASAGNAAGFCVQYQDRPLERGKKPHPCSREKPAGGTALGSAAPGLGEPSGAPAPGPGTFPPPPRPTASCRQALLGFSREGSGSASPSINLDAKEVPKAPSTRACEAAQPPRVGPGTNTDAAGCPRGAGSAGIALIHRTTDPILPNPPPGKDGAGANLLLYGWCRSPQRPTPPSDTAIPATRHPAIPLPHRGSDAHPTATGTAGQGPPALPSPTVATGLAPRRAPSNRTGRRCHGEGSAASRSPPPRSHRRGPARAPPPGAPQRRCGTPQPPCLGGRAGGGEGGGGDTAPRSAGIGGRLNRRRTRKATPIPRRAARRGSLTERQRTRTRYLPALRGAEPARPLPTMGRGRPAPPRSAARPRPAR